MSRKKSFVLWSLVVLVVSLFSLDSLTAVCAQTRGRTRRRSPGTQRRDNVRPADAQNVVAENAPDEATPAQRRAKFDEAIQKNCKSLEQTIKTADVSLAEIPFDKNQPDAAFLTQCSADGTLTWTATRVATNEAVTTAYDHTVVIKTPQLEINRIGSENGVVTFVSEIPTIVVQNIPSAQLEWWIDLRHEKYAIKFTNDLRELFYNLAERTKLPPPG